MPDPAIPVIYRRLASLYQRQADGSPPIFSKSKIMKFVAEGVIEIHRVGPMCFVHETPQELLLRLAEAERLAKQEEEERLAREALAAPEPQAEAPAPPPARGPPPAEPRKRGRPPGSKNRNLVRRDVQHAG